VVDLQPVRQVFERATDFNTSPLYRVLSATVAGNDYLLRLAAQGRPGQYPTFLFFGAVHHVLLAGADHELATFYPSIVGTRARPAVEAEAALVSFCHEYEAQLTVLLQTRLVQTNHVQRSLALRLGLAVIADEVDEPVHLVEVGASAGLNLRFDRYGYRLGGRWFGDRESPVQLVAEWYSDTAVPDLDAIPPVASVTGVDLNPVDARDATARRWLEALIWPENSHQRALLSAALNLVAADPPTILTGDVIDVCPALAAELPATAPRVVFHAATRMHVPADRLRAFDRALSHLGTAGPLYRLSLETDQPDPDPRQQPARPGVALTLYRPDGTRTDLAVAEGHLHWIEPLQLKSTTRQRTAVGEPDR
jgi:hypothetical protein